MVIVSDLVDAVADEIDTIHFAVADVARAMRRIPSFSCEIVGALMCQWLQDWLEKRGYSYRTNPNTQMPPDFFLSPRDHKRNLLEIKAFNSDASPGFDIADFTMYSEEIIREPYMLDVDYLIFGYQMSDEGVVTIKNVWLKKVWEITRRMADWPLNLQVKKDVVHKVRPGVWYSTRPRDFKMFTCLEHFLSAMEETVYQNEDTRKKGSQWKNRFLASYKAFTGKTLIIPKWDEIKDSYLVVR